MWLESLFLLCLTICISCPVPIIPEIKYSWVFNGQRSFLQQDARRFISQKTGNLYIAKVEASDAGNYTCAVRNMMTNSTVFSSPTPVVVRRDGEHHHHQSALWLSVYEINHLSELVVTCATALALLLCFKWYDFSIYSLCSGDGRIRAKDRGSVSWHPSCLQRIVSETGMLCLRKVSGTTQSTGVFAEQRRQLLSNTAAAIFPVMVEQENVACVTSLCLTSAALCLPSHGEELMEIHSLARLKSTTPAGFWKFHIFAQRMLACTSV